MYLKYHLIIILSNMDCIKIQHRIWIIFCSANHFKGFSNQGFSRSKWEIWWVKMGSFLFTYALDNVYACLCISIIVCLLINQIFLFQWHSKVCSFCPKLQLHWVEIFPFFRDTIEFYFKQHSSDRYCSKKIISQVL